jgi:hypothetical protein
MKINLVALSFCAALISGCGKSPAEKLFVDGCTSGGSSTKVCKCVFQGLQRQYGEDEVEKMFETGRTPPDFLGTVQVGGMFCRHKYDE